MTKIYTAPRDEKAYLSLLQKKLNNKDYIGALLVTDSISMLDSYDKLNLCVTRAKIYYLMKHYARSAEEWFKYLSLTSNEKLYPRAYNGLGACFFKMQDGNVAGYYFNRQIIANKKGVYDYSSVTAEFYEEMLSADKNYYLAYPYEKADFTQLLSKAEELLRAEDYDGALELIKVIPNSSKFYSSALISSSIAKYFKGDIEGATNDIEQAVSIDKKAVAVCNAISMFHSIKNQQKVDYYLDILSKLKVVEEEDLYKVAMVYAEKGEHLKAVGYAEKYLKINPYDTTMLLIYGIMNYNLKRFEKAEESFEKIYKINRSYIAKSYINFVKETSKDDCKPIEYTFDLNVFDRQRLVKLLSDLIKLSGEEKLEREDEIYNLSSYAFSSTSYQVQSTIITLLGELATIKAQSIMKKMLLSLNVYDRVKSGVIGFLVASKIEGEISACFGNIFRKITLTPLGIENKAFEEAYAYLIAKLAPVEKELLPLKYSAETLYDKAVQKNVNFDEIDVKSLSAVMYELSTIAKIKSRREFIKFFDANASKIKKIKELLKD